MKPGEMEIVLPRCMGTSFARARTTLRALRPAGLVKSNGRTPKAAIMTPRDVAAAVIPLLVYDLPGKRSVEAVQHFGGLVYHGEPENLGADTLEALRGLKAPFTFLEALTALVEIYVADPRAAGCDVEILSGEQSQAKIRFGRSVYYFEGPLPTVAQAQAAAREIPPVNSVRWITDANLRPLAAQLEGAA